MRCEKCGNEMSEVTVWSDDSALQVDRWCWKCGESKYLSRIAELEVDVSAQSARIRELVEGLERLEWSGSDDYRNSYCPACNRYKYSSNSKHKDDCWLSALIKRGKAAYEKG